MTLPGTTTFPDAFVWGAATSSYQIEGAVETDGRGPSIWDTLSHTPGRIADGSTGDVAVDHYHRVEQDVQLMQELGLHTYRFSVAWPRIVPDGDGEVEPRGLAFYRRLVGLLRQADIEPMVTLYHWDLPQALQDRGGWANRATADAFVRYARVVQDELGGDVRRWTTLNEPWCASFLGYAAGEHAPGITDPRAAFRAAHHLLLAHGDAIAAMRGAGGDDHDLGIVLNLVPVVADTEDPADLAAAHQLDGSANRLFLDALLRGGYPDDVAALFARFRAADAVLAGDADRIAQPIDLLGVNYYTRTHVRAGSGAPTLGSAHPGCDDVQILPPEEPLTTMGWSVEPEGLEALLLRLRDDYAAPPVMICENGAAYPDHVAADGTIDDPDRIAYLDVHLRAVARAIQAGADVRGYLVWSLLDNFEWAHGYRQRFGIVHVDAAQRRTLKASARWYRDVIARNGLTDLA